MAREDSEKENDLPSPFRSRIPTISNSVQTNHTRCTRPRYHGRSFRDFRGSEASDSEFGDCDCGIGGAGWFDDGWCRGAEETFVPAAGELLVWDTK